MEHLLDSSITTEDDSVSVTSTISFDLAPPVPARPVRKKYRTSSFTNHRGANESILIEIGVLSKYFHLPITEAAKKIGASMTTIKKNCRRLGISRWPHRTLCNFDTTIKKIRNGSVGKRKHYDELKQDLDIALQSKQDFLDSVISGPKLNMKHERLRRSAVVYRHTPQISDDDDSPREFSQPKVARVALLK